MNTSGYLWPEASADMLRFVRSDRLEIGKPVNKTLSPEPTHAWSVNFLEAES